MRKLIFGFVLFSLFACVDDRDVFIPEQSSGPIDVLKQSIATPSVSRILSANQSQEINTVANTQLSLDAGILQGQGEVNYELSFIELKTYKDYILHRVDHFTDHGAISCLYSFYIALDNNELSTKSWAPGKTARIRVPLEKSNNSLMLGRGDFESGNLSWRYDDMSLNDNIRYIEWIAIDNEGMPFTQRGYEIQVNASGWYSLVSVSDASFEYKSVCLSYGNGYDASNTVSFLLSSMPSYLAQINLEGLSNNQHCSEEVPFNEDIDYTLVSISQIGEQYYFYKKLLTDEESLHFINPRELELEEIQEELIKL